MSFFSLEGKTAIVTGGASGIGSAVVDRFIAAGATVVIADRRDPSPASGAPEHISTDVADETQVAALVDAIVAKHRGFDIMVNNAGIQPLGVRFQDLTTALLRRTLDVNVHGIAFGIKHAGRVMKEGGRILNTSSFVGTLGIPAGTAYAASKAAVSHLTKCVSLELAPYGITVNAVAPGTIATPAVLGIAGNPEIPFAESRPSPPSGGLVHRRKSPPPFTFSPRRKPPTSPGSFSPSMAASPPDGNDTTSSPPRK